MHASWSQAVWILCHAQDSCNCNLPRGLLWILCRQAGRWQESARILQQLIENAVVQRQYLLAASLHYQLAMETLDEVSIAD